MSFLLPLSLLSDRHPLLSSMLENSDSNLQDESFLGSLLPKNPRKNRHHPYNQSLRSTTNSKLKRNYTVNVDVQQFKPEEISVRSVNDDTIVIECKHEEKPDEHGSVYRHFVRKYKVPKDHDVSKCTSKLSSDGVLTVICSKKADESRKCEIEIPVTYTNQPSTMEQPSNNQQEPHTSEKEK